MIYPMNDITKLPKWAQKLIRGLEEQNKHLKHEVLKIEEINSALHTDGAHWFTLFHPKLSNRKDKIVLFKLDKNSAQQVCYLYPDDLIFVARGGMRDEKTN